MELTPWASSNLNAVYGMYYFWQTLIKEQKPESQKAQPIVYFVG
jgi:hypothetical protein